MSSISPAIPVGEERKAMESRGDARRRYLLYIFVGILLLVRFDGLGSRPLVDDEYFSVTSVEYILEKGVPEFPTGGYYVRGLPLQYLQAASVHVFGDNEFGHRLPNALFGVLTLILVFFYARIFLPEPLAATCVAILAVSAWQIEFGRFSRMYAQFQCVTVGLKTLRVGCSLAGLSTPR
jgi:4-amino-4-deoxy-L-arabinose transferase-like glycosyltransferase